MSVTRVQCHITNLHTGYISSPVNYSNQQLVVYQLSPADPSVAPVRKTKQITPHTLSRDVYNFCHDHLGSAMLIQHSVIS